MADNGVDEMQIGVGIVESSEITGMRSIIRIATIDRGLLSS